MATWLFLRHGTTIANQGRWLSGWQDLPLLPKGQAEACLAGIVLAKESFERVLVSDLLRARQTALGALTAAGFAIQDGCPQGLSWTLCPELRERRLGEWQGRLLDELRAAGASKDLISWEGQPPGGESLRDVALRSLGFLALQPDRPTLVVAHGGTLRVVLGVLDGDERETIGRKVMGNGQIVRREVTGNCWQRVLRSL